MPRTPADNDLHESRQERAIEDLLVDYPYLIASHLTRPKRQYYLNDTDRIDLFFKAGDEVWIAEIKAQTCTVACVRQLMRYVQHLLPAHPVVRGLLIGPGINSAASKLLQAGPYDLRFLKLDEDVPRKIVVCRDCRKAYAARLDVCPDCRTSQVIY
ncbi:uncharacterized protein DUF91 [Prosthecobacter fusiformis]|uniref:Uncharacterized protein DUF91 n=1 Tax=Prosthecobacter fusiformis TaxID=48464 RepID=A0A4R7RK02_9BACT|nr:endonuclease NucS domain-containing protein [Prosthecobacter fusiformis]TDU62507.1 uncharacterized protein DUF91 [Prosthecobacter fusiformis]